MAGFPVSTAGSARPRLRTTSPRGSRTTHAGSGCAGSHISASVLWASGTHTPRARSGGQPWSSHTFPARRRCQPSPDPVCHLLRRGGGNISCRPLLQTTSKHAAPRPGSRATCPAVQPWTVTPHRGWGPRYLPTAPPAHAEAMGLEAPHATPRGGTPALRGWPLPRTETNSRGCGGGWVSGGGALQWPLRQRPVHCRLRRWPQSKALHAPGHSGSRALTASLPPSIQPAIFRAGSLSSPARSHPCRSSSLNEVGSLSRGRR